MGWFPLAPSAYPTLLHPTPPPLCSTPRGPGATKETREGAAARGARTRPASGNSRVTTRRRRAPRGEAVADRWRLRTGSAHCAPQLPNRPPARQPPVRRVSLREYGGGYGACGRSRGLLFLSVLLTPTPHPFPSPRLRHLPAPHTQDKNALSGTTQQRLDGFGHGPAVAYPQHHLQPLRLGESLPAVTPLASVTAAPLCLSGSRRTPLRTRRASSQALALRCREPPTPSS